MRPARNRARILSFALAFLLLVPFAAGCARTPERRSVTYFDLFDTQTEFTAYGLDREAFDKAARELHAELFRWHTLADPYHAYEGLVNLYAINERGGKTEFELEPELFSLFELGRTFYDESGGKLNVAMGSVLSLWHDCFEAGDRIPETEALEQAGGHIGFSSVSLDAEKRTIRIGDSGVRFDLGALTKGAAADAAGKLLSGLGVKDYALNLGGNVLVSGKKPGGNWAIGVQNPEGGILTRLSLCDISAVTSGDYQRCMTVDGRTYHHIIDPDTYAPASLYRSVTVLCASSALADALSTSLFCMEQTKGKALAEKYGAQVLWVYADGHTERTEGFAAYEA